MADDQRLREAYAGAQARAGGDHPSDETWERLALDELPAAERDALMDHVTRCPSCAGLYRGLRELESEARTFDPGVPKPRARRRLASPAWYAGLAAAAVLIIAFLLPFRQPTSRPTDPGLVRSPVSAAPEPVRPIGPLSARPARLEWRELAGADGYRVELWNGGPVWSQDGIEGTSVALPGDVALSPGVVYYWKVTALAGPDRRLSSDVASPLVSFEIQPLVPQP
jgi:hypothetical protein